MRKSTQLDWYVRVQAAIHAIHGSLDEPASFRDLAGYAASSPYHFHRRFQSATGESVADCSRRLRLERAAHILATSRTTVTEIACEVGFDSLEAFSRAFQAAYHLSPSAFRRRPGLVHVLSSPAGIHYRPDGVVPDAHLHRRDIMDVRIVELPPMRLLAMHCENGYYGMPTTWNRFISGLQEHGLLAPDARLMGVFFDHVSDAPENKKRVDIGMVVEETVQPPDGMHILEFAGGTYAVTPHFGPCLDIGDTWARWWKEWLPESGWKLRKDGISLEWYQNSCQRLPEELSLTFLCDPVERA